MIRRPYGAGQGPGAPLDQDAALGCPLLSPALAMPIVITTRPGGTHSRRRWSCTGTDPAAASHPSVPGLVSRASDASVFQRASVQLLCRQVRSSWKAFREPVEVHDGHGPCRARLMLAPEQVVAGPRVLCPAADHGLCSLMSRYDHALCRRSLARQDSGI